MFVRQTLQAKESNTGGGGAAATAGDNLSWDWARRQVRCKFGDMLSTQGALSVLLPVWSQNWRAPECCNSRSTPCYVFEDLTASFSSRNDQSARGMPTVVPGICWSCFEAKKSVTRGKTSRRFAHAAAVFFDGLCRRLATGAAVLRVPSPCRPRRLASWACRESGSACRDEHRRQRQGPHTCRCRL